VRKQGVTTSVQAPAPTPGAAPGKGGRGLRQILGGLTGVLAAAVALGVAELAAGVVGPASSPVIAVGDAAITLTPEPVKHFAITTFGENDKIALVSGTLVVIAMYAVLLGLLGLRSRRLGVLGIALFGLIGAGIVALLALLAPLTVSTSTVDGGRPRDAVIDRPREVTGAHDRAGAGLDRRGFFVASGIALGAAALTGGGGRLLQRRFDVAEARAALQLPAPASPAAALPVGADLARTVDGVTPLVTRNRDFYRVDTAITVPQVRPADYRLSLTGMFDSPRTWTLADLYGRDDLIERDITLTCVSNEVGGSLAGAARWLGVPLGAFLRENGVRSGSSQLVCRSVDGMTIGAPTRSALDVEDAMLAIGMNGEPLPVEHGFPVRMVIPGLYGYVSACKWLTRIEATTYEAFDAYWVRRQWAAQAPIKIASRIDTPAPLRSFPAGRRPVAGVAWAQTRGIARVEVRVDDGEWAEADLAPEIDADLWRQWVLPHDFAPGRHTVTVRATSADGERQTDARAAPFPSGASGWHSIQVSAA
jgi:DMSO/TMAO reductase YedYZ molybdopterin-dependent catalytic subunit